MANRVWRFTDTTPTEVFATAAFPSSPTVTDWIEVAGFTHVDWFIDVGSQQNVTDLSATVEYEYQNTSPTVPATGYTLSLEQLAEGPPPTADQSPYAVEAVGAISGSVTQYAVSVPVHGRYMRLVFSGGPSVGTDTATVNALRRTA